MPQDFLVDLVLAFSQLQTTSHRKEGLDSCLSVKTGIKTSYSGSLVF